MDGLLTLGGLLVLAFFIGVPYLLVSHTRLKSRVTDLELEISDLRRRFASRAERPSETEGEARPGPWRAARTKGDETPVRAGASTPPDRAIPPKAPDFKPRAPVMAADTSNTDEIQRQSPPRAFVFTAEKLDRLTDWLRVNWVLAVAAASLAFAGLFMVQYGVEHGLLTPFWRVMSALGFGAALIMAGEWIRRRHGDSEEDGDPATAFLPSTLSGAGLIVLFAGVLSARVLYDLISPGTALAGLCAVALLAIVLGWFYGPVLAAVGIVGATAAPFLVGGESDAPWIFYYYFLLIAVAGLAVDTIRRWAWVSALSLILTLGGMALLYLGDAGELHFLIAVLATTFAALTIPVRSLVPNHSGASFFGDMLGKKPGARAFPEFPTRIALGVIVAASLAAAWVASQAATPEQVWLSLAALLLLLVATLIWMARAPALFDLALIPGAAFLLTLMSEVSRYGPLYRQFRAPLGHNDPETLPPDTAFIAYTLTAMGVIVTALAFWRMRSALRDEGADIAPVIWALAASVFAPGVVLILEFLWLPAPVIGDMPWALTTIAVAAVMTLLAERCAHGADTARLKLRIGLFAIAALTMIALAVFLLLTKSALTLALGVMVLLTALLDRKFDLPVLGWFLQLGVAVISYRLIVDPGLFWAIERASFLQVLLAYLGAIALLGTAWAVLRGSVPNPSRGNSQVIVESALWTLGAVFICILLARLFDEADFESHWGAGLLATVWLTSALNQAYRLRAPGLSLHWLRVLLCVVFSLVGIGFLALQGVLFNPLLSEAELVAGPLIFDSLMVAYLPVALVFAVAAWKLTSLHRQTHILLIILSSLYGATYIGFEIRRFWRGRDLSVHGFTDAELYSYTLAMLLGAVLLLMLAFSRRSDVLRKLAMAGVALTIAKVFLIDMSGLSGLTRVFSFMGLGLALVALAWLNRKMSEQWDRSGPGDPPDAPPEPDDTTSAAPGDVTLPETNTDK